MAAPGTVQFVALSRTVANPVRLTNPFVRGSSTASDGLAAIGQSPAGEKVSITYVISTSSPSWRTQIRHPQLIRPPGRELALDAIEWSLGDVRRDRGAAAPPTHHAAQA